MPDTFAPRAILVEGVECAGKTTLIGVLREQIGWDCKALSHRPGDQFERFMREYLHGHETIFNRGHYSEIVYSALWSRAEPFSISERAALSSYLTRHFVVVHCTAEIEALRTRYRRRGHPQRARESELAQISQLFGETFTTISHVPYVSTDPEALKLAAERIVALVTNDHPRPRRRTSATSHGS